MTTAPQSGFSDGHVFISYARLDGKDFAQFLHDKLAEISVNAWMDTQSIQAGELFYTAIRDALRDAVVVVVILTPGAVASHQVEAEWNHALNHYLPVIPLMVRDCEIPYALGVYNYIDCRSDQQTIGITSLITRLRTISKTHTAFLQEKLTSFKKAATGEYIGAFQEKILALTNSMEIWGRHFKSQHELVEEQKTRMVIGIQNERDQFTKQLEVDAPTTGRKVVGQPLVSATHFRDRSDQLKLLSELLSRPETRLVSVIGRGGIGKSGIVTKLLYDLENHHWQHTPERISVDGIIYLSMLTKGISLDRIFAACSELLDEKKKDKFFALWVDTSLSLDYRIEIFLEEYRHGIYILLLDNLEDLIDKNRQLIDDDLQRFFEITLKSTHGIRLLVTSRVPLRLPRDLMKLDNQILLKDGLPETDAVSMLKDLDPNNHNRLHNAPPEKLKALARTVRGVPRALQVAASILSSDPFISLDDLLKWKHIFRQKEFVEELVQANYRLFDSDTRRVLEALSVFGRPVPEVAIDYLLEPFVETIFTRAILVNLAQIHMIEVDNRSGNLVSLHPIDKDYIYSQLPEVGDYQRMALHRRAYNYYAQFQTPREKWEHIKYLEPYLEMFGHLIKAEDYTEAAKILDVLDANYLLPWGYFSRVLSMRKQLEKRLKDQKLEANNLMGLGEAHRMLGDAATAIAYLERAVDLSTQMNDQHNLAYKVSALGHAYQNLGANEKAIRCQEDALKIAREIGDDTLTWTALDHLGVVYRSIGDHTKSLEYLREALEIVTLVGDDHGRSNILANISNSLMYVDQVDKALEILPESLALSVKTHDYNQQVRALVNLCFAHALTGQAQKALEYGQQAFSLAESMNYRRYLGFACEGLGRAYVLLRDVEHAQKYLQRAVVISREINNLLGEVQALAAIAVVYQESGQLEKALATLNELLPTVKKLGNSHLEGMRFELIGNLYAKAGRIPDAIHQFQAAIASFEASGSVTQVEAIKKRLESLPGSPDPHSFL